MRTAKYDVLITMTYVIKKYKGNWCYITRGKLLELLKFYHSVEIGYRQLGNHLADLRNSGLIKSIRRNHRREDGTFCLLSSARCLTIKGCKYLISRGFTWASIQLQRLKAKYRPPEKGRPDDETTPRQVDEAPRKPGENPFLDPIFRKKHGLKPLPPWKFQES